MGAPVLVAETPVRVQWATQPTGPGGVPIDGATLDGVKLPGPGAYGKQEQLDYAVVRPTCALHSRAPCAHAVPPQRTAVATYSHLGGAPPPVPPRLAHRELVTYEDI